MFAWSDRLLLLQAIRTLLGMVGNSRVLALTLLRALGTAAGRLEAPEVVRIINFEMAIAERLAAANLDNPVWQRDVFVSHDRIGDMLVAAQGDGAGALQPIAPA